MSEFEDRNIEVTTVPVGSIIWDVSYQAREKVNEEVVAEYTEYYRSGVKMPRVVAFRLPDGKLLGADGWHRDESSKRAGLEMIEVEIRDGTEHDLRVYAAGANATHGLRRTNADKRRSVQMLLDDPICVEWSDHKIAETVGVSHTFVANMRGSSTGNGCQSTERLGRDGRRPKVANRRSSGGPQNAVNNKQDDEAGGDGADAHEVDDAALSGGGAESDRHTEDHDDHDDDHNDDEEDWPEDEVEPETSSVDVDWYVEENTVPDRFVDLLQETENGDKFVACVTVFKPEDIY